MNGNADALSANATPPDGRRVTPRKLVYGQKPQERVFAIVMAAPLVQRRRFTVEYKLWIVREADRLANKGEKKGELTAFLQREGLYSSHLAMWRRAREHGDLINVPKRGRKRKLVDPNAKRLADLERRLAKTMARAERAEALVEQQRKSTRVSAE
jgi:transposase